MHRTFDDILIKKSLFTNCQAISFPVWYIAKPEKLRKLRNLPWKIKLIHSYIIYFNILLPIHAKKYVNEPPNTIISQLLESFISCWRISISPKTMAVNINFDKSKKYFANISLRILSFSWPSRFISCCFSHVPILQIYKLYNKEEKSSHNKKSQVFKSRFPLTCSLWKRWAKVLYFEEKPYLCKPNIIKMY